MLWYDFRAYLNRLDELGELETVLGCDWQEEIGGITELVTEERGAALLFDEIRDYPKGYRVAANLFNTPSRTATALGIALEPSIDGVADRFARKLKDFRPVPPEEVSDGPVLENVLTGAEVDLFKFPTPKWHENDGGRYIGTGVCVIQKDPDTPFVNSGAYRVAVHDETTCTIFIEHGKHGDVIRRKYWERGEKCPVLISVGQEPVLTALGSSSIYRTPHGVSEFEVAGYLHGGPYPILRGSVTGLPMPATAEIVIEGFIPSPDGDGLLLEGPFGEWTGYYAHGRRPETRIEVRAVYHRNDPIIFGASPTRPVGCDYFASFGGDSHEARQRLEKAGIPGIGRIVALARPHLYAVAVEQMYRDHVSDVIKVLVPGGDRYNGHQTWIVVDDDIDVTDPREVLWAVASRCRPESGVQVIPGTAVWQLDPRIPPEEHSNPDAARGRASYTAHNLVIDACRPYDWIDAFPPVCVNGPELRRKIRAKWGHLLSRRPPAPSPSGPPAPSPSGRGLG